MTVLITGAGVIGSQIARILVERGEQPVLMDFAPQEDALNQIVDLETVSLVRGDVLSQFSLSEVILRHKVERIIHTVANPMLTMGAYENPYAAIQLNIMGTVNVLEAARIMGLKRVVVSSSSTAGHHIDGGEGKGNKALEEAYPRPVTLYASTKLAIENIGLNYAKWNGVDFAAVRYGAVAGPWGGKGGGGPTGAFHTIVSQALRGEEVVVPSIAFEWVYSKDAAEGTVQALYAADLKTRVFYITMGTVVSPDQLAEAVLEVVPGAKVRIDDTPSGGLPLPDLHVESDITLAREALGYSPQYGIVESVRDMAEWLAVHDKA